VAQGLPRPPCASASRRGIEILYPVQVSFREHGLVPEPFVLVAMIAAVRRILVLTAEFGKLMERGAPVFRYAMIEQP
jgi:hypothetical protein